MTSTANNNNKMTLYHFAGATSKATNIVLGWTGEEANTVNPYSSHSGLGDNYADKVNPARAVPSLFIPNEEDGNKKPLVLTQNLAVLMYLAKRAGRQDLVGGNDLLDQAEVLKWLSFLASDVHSSFWVFFFTDRYTTSDNAEAIEQTKQGGVNMIYKKLAILENHMEGRQWVATENKTVVDALAYVMVSWASAFFADKMKQDWPNLTAFAARMGEDDGVKAAMKYEDEEKYGIKR